mgnify:CR=1 FL=1
MWTLAYNPTAQALARLILARLSVLAIWTLAIHLHKNMVVILRLSLMIRFLVNATIAIQRDSDVGDVEVQPNLNIASTVLVLPFVLPAVLPTSVKKRIASDLRKYEKWRLINISVTSEANKMAVRQITAAANPDTIEVQKTI